VFKFGIAIIKMAWLSLSDPRTFMTDFMVAPNLTTSMAISLAVSRVFTSLVQQYWMPTDVYRPQAPMRTACSVDVQFAGKKPLRHSL
jgi:hypothetical protein